MRTVSSVFDAEIFPFFPFFFFSQSFKLNVDSHCALKEAVVEEGRQLLELIVSHKSGKSFWNIASLYISRLLKNEEALL